MNAKTASITYWITTALLSVALLASGSAKLAGVEPIAQNMARLGYPPYFTTILGGWYVAGAIALLAPGLERAREWAYAGAFFAFSGAIASHVAFGDPLVRSVPLFVLLALTLTSRALLWTRRRS